MATVQPTPPPNWLVAIDRQRRPVAQALLALAAVLVLAAGFVWYKYGGSQAAVIAATFLFAAAAAAGGLWYLSGPTGELAGADAARILVLAEGGVLGLALTLFTLWQTVHWRKDVIGGMEAWRGEDRWHLALLAATGLAGLAVMFLSLLLARGEENVNRTLRVLLYGYNAVLTGLLLLVVLIVINVFCYIKLPKTQDWTASGIYTLDEKSANVLKGLSKPVHLYVLEEDRETGLSRATHELMENVRSASDKVTVEYLVRDLNPEAVAAVVGKYKLPDDLGVLVVYGSGDSELHQFIRQSELMSVPPMNPMDPDAPPPTPTFKGEDLLMSAISFMEEGQKKPVLYFLQGNGALDAFGLDPNAKPERRAQALADRLRDDHYEVKGLLLADTPLPGMDSRVTVSASVPEDATALVIAGPREKFSDKQLKALRDYMAPADPKRKKGKMMVLLDVAPDPEDPKKMAALGLEGLLADYDVEAPPERVLRPDVKAPAVVLVVTNPELRGKNPLATAFERPIGMENLRVVRPRSGAPMKPGASPYQADRLLVTSPFPNQINQMPVFAESNLGDPRQVVEGLLKNEDQLDKRLVASLSVGVAVSDPSSGDANDPHAFMRRPGGEGAPRLVAIGTSQFASDAIITGGRPGDRRAARGSVGYDLFASAVAWLRDKPSSIGVTNKDRGYYKIQDSADLFSMILRPALLMALGVIGLGLGVWVVRRR